jgi:hypothetical protein
MFNETGAPRPWKALTAITGKKPDENEVTPTNVPWWLVPAGFAFVSGVLV